MTQFTLIALLFFTCNSLSLATAKKMPGDHLHGPNNCAQCHLAGIDINKILRSDPSCSNCHTTETLNTFVKNLLVGEYTQTKKITIKPQDKPVNPYYEKTKIGIAPNTMLKIEAGSFTMGSNEQLSDEGPQHSVTTSAFFMDKYEVTNGQYKTFIDATQRKSPVHFRNRTYPHGKVDHPVIFVNWKDASDYCQWADKRLPTEVEWEKAARGTDARTYPWGNDLTLDSANTSLRWASLNQFGDTTPVGMFDKGVSPYGLHDMSGNVWEWTSSWYNAYPGNPTFSENYGERYKTLKGGSWLACSFYKCGISVSTYNRAFFAKKVKNDTFGFRCAKSL